MAQSTPQHDPARDQPKPTESRRDWEDVQTNATDKTERLKVNGGWLYRTVFNGAQPALTFVPDQRTGMTPA